MQTIKLYKQIDFWNPEPVYQEVKTIVVENNGGFDFAYYNNVDKITLRTKNYNDSNHFGTTEVILDKSNHSNLFYQFLEEFDEERECDIDKLKF